MKRIPYRTELKGALWFSGIRLGWTAAERLLGLHDTHIQHQHTVDMFFIFPALTIYMMAMQHKKRTVMQGQMNYLDGLISGLIMTAMITVMSPLVIYLGMSVISPSYFSHAIAYVTSKGMMSTSVATDYFSLPHFMKQAAVGHMSLGSITAAVTAYFVRSKSA